MSRALETACALAIAAASGCGAPGHAPEAIGETREALLEGGSSAASQDFVVRVRTGNSGNYCTGVLVDPQIVLTAQHCLVEDSITFPGGQNDSVDCVLGTTPILPSSIEVDFGSQFAAPSLRASVQSVVVNVANISCHEDVAALVLANPVTDASITSELRPLLLDPLPASALGETVTAIGWGCVDDQDDGATTRQQAMGPIASLPASPKTVLAPDGQPIVGLDPAFVVAGIESCVGDFGDPLLDNSGAILGIVSQNQSDTTTTVDGQDLTTPSDSVSLASPLAPVAPFLTQIYQSLGRMPWRAPRPAPPAGIGESCVENDECDSNFCVLVGEDAGPGHCSSPCVLDGGAAAENDGGAEPEDAAVPALEAVATCPPPTVCTALGGTTPVCLAPSAAPKARGCSTPPGGRETPWPSGALVALLAGAAVIRRRRAPTC